MYWFEDDEEEYLNNKIDWIRQVEISKKVRSETIKERFKRKGKTFIDSINPNISKEDVLVIDDPNIIIRANAIKAGVPKEDITKQDVERYTQGVLRTEEDVLTRLKTIKTTKSQKYDKLMHFARSVLRLDFRPRTPLCDIKDRIANNVAHNLVSYALFWQRYPIKTYKGQSTCRYADINREINPNIFPKEQSIMDSTNELMNDQFYLKQGDDALNKRSNKVHRPKKKNHLSKKQRLKNRIVRKLKEHLDSKDDKAYKEFAQEYVRKKGFLDARKDATNIDELIETLKQSKYYDLL